MYKMIHDAVDNLRLIYVQLVNGTPSAEVKLLQEAFARLEKEVGELKEQAGHLQE